MGVSTGEAMLTVDSFESSFFYGQLCAQPRLCILGCLDSFSLYQGDVIQDPVNVIFPLVPVKTEYLTLLICPLPTPIGC